MKCAGCGVSHKYLLACVVTREPAMCEDCWAKEQEEDLPDVFVWLGEEPHWKPEAKS